MMIKLMLLPVLLVALSIQAAHAEEVTLIFNNSLQKGELTSKVLRKVFLGRYNSSENGYAISPCYLDNGNVLQALYNVTRKSDQSFRRYWNKRVFSGTGAPPNVFSNAQQVSQFVANNKGAVCLTLTGRDIPTDAVIMSID